MSVQPQQIRDAVARHGRVARVVVAEAKGSAPREAGASMLVWPAGQSGTIGGGALEFEATERARSILRGEASEGAVRRPLGPALGQCCGGSVTLVTELIDEDRLTAIEDAGPLWARPMGPDGAASLAVERLRARISSGAPAPSIEYLDGWLVEAIRPSQHLLWVHGAGHVGRAIVDTLSPLPDWAMTWVDTGRDRFPRNTPSNVDVLLASDPARAVAHAPVDAHHLVLTYSHALDLALCDALLRRRFASAGLIGSATKWARFRARLRDAGHSESTIDRITCPIGLRALGKHPQAIAIGVATQLVSAVATGYAAEEDRA